jgi:hypothetical protein
MCLKQNLPKEQWQVYIEKLVKTTDAPDKFLLTEEQLVQIAIEENISIAEGIYLCYMHSLLFRIQSLDKYYFIKYILTNVNSIVLSSRTYGNIAGPFSIE